MDSQWPFVYYLFVLIVIQHYFVNSGGQRRRVSLAISLMHDPKIIIIDEPTVGIDSLIRHK